jgi:ParB-like chromosome segregation protein Spo0J
MEKTQAWRNRIVGYSDEPPDQLLASPWNWRVHPKSQQDALAAALREVGYVQNVICNRTTGNVVDGHLRVSLALRTEQPTVPVTWVELSETEEKLVLATIDPIGAMAEADSEILNELLSGVSTGEQALQELLARLAEDTGIVPPDVQFKEYDESAADDVEYLECPECGHKWPK